MQLSFTVVQTNMLNIVVIDFCYPPCVSLFGYSFRQVLCQKAKKPEAPQISFETLYVGDVWNEV